MKQNPSHTKTPASRDREDAARPSEPREREHRSERQWRIGAAQMAAPSTRRWRRAGSFGSSS
jgi:hypothetical protein